MADQGAPQAEKVVLSLERQAEALRTLMINVAERIELLRRTTDKEDAFFTYTKAAADVARIKAMIAAGAVVPALKGTSWPVIEQGFSTMRDGLVAKKWIPK
ncbi:hypothetical protein K2P56_03245 [Patescibacteria group bacterium]|nr:hypothetical protein [Patescibacteria group bacterium]